MSFLELVGSVSCVTLNYVHLDFCVCLLRSRAEYEKIKAMKRLQAQRERAEKRGRRRAPIYYGGENEAHHGECDGGVGEEL